MCTNSLNESRYASSARIDEEGGGLGSALPRKSFRIFVEFFEVIEVLWHLLFPR